MGFLKSSLLALSALPLISSQETVGLRDETMVLQNTLGYALHRGTACTPSIKDAAGLLAKVDVWFAKGSSPVDEIAHKWELNDQQHNLANDMTGGAIRSCALAKSCGARKKTSKIALSMEVDEFLRSLEENMGQNNLSEDDAAVLNSAVRVLNARKELLYHDITGKDRKQPLFARTGEEAVYAKELAKVQAGFVIFLQQGTATPRMAATIATLTERLDELRARKRCTRAYWADKYTCSQ